MLPMPVRIKFSKLGNLKYISHLDLQRTMKSALLRSGLPIYYSEGFNPHPKMIFALPLSIGAESTCEYLDIKLTKEADLYYVKDRLNSVMVDNIFVKEAYVPDTKFKSIAWAEYEILTDDKYDPEKLLKDEIIVEKRTKRGERSVNIRPQIKETDFGQGKIRIIVDATSENFLNPEYAVKVLGLQNYAIVRTGVYLADGITPFR